MGNHPTRSPSARLWAVSLPPIWLYASWMDNASANTNHRKDMNTGMTPFLRPSRKFCASSVRLLTMLEPSSEPFSGNKLLNNANRRSRSASIGGSECFGVY